MLSVRVEHAGAEVLPTTVLVCAYVLCYIGASHIAEHPIHGEPEGPGGRVGLHDLSARAGLAARTGVPEACHLDLDTAHLNGRHLHGKKMMLFMCKCTRVLSRGLQVVRCLCALCSPSHTNRSASRFGPIRCFAAAGRRRVPDPRVPRPETCRGERRGAGVQQDADGGGDRGGGSRRARSPGVEHALPHLQPVTRPLAQTDNGRHRPLRLTMETPAAWDSTAMCA